MYFKNKKAQIGLISRASQTTTEKAKTVLDLINKLDKEYLIERLNGVKIYSYNAIEVVDKFFKDNECCVVSTAMPNIDETYGSYFITYQWPNEVIMRTYSFYYKY